MKRGHVTVLQVEVEWEQEEYGGRHCKAKCLTSIKDDIKPPPGIICKKLPPRVISLVNDMTDIEGTNKFLFFLGVQGKEYIDDIEKRFKNYGWSIPLFISANIDVGSRHHTQDLYSTNEQCRALGSYFGLMDPIGGGLYPLHYLLVLDRFDHLRCKLPIQVNQWVSPQERFGVNIRDLGAVVESYIMYLEQK